MQITNLVRRMYQSINDEMAKADCPFTACQYVIMASISAKPGINQTEICTATGVDRSTTAQVIAHLQKSGHIKRVRNKQDARAYVVTLTDEGKAVFARARASCKTAEREVKKTYPILAELHEAAE